MHQVLASGYTSAFSVKDRIYIFLYSKESHLPIWSFDVKNIEHLCNPIFLSPLASLYDLLPR